MKKLSVKGLAICGICIAVAFVLSFIKFLSLPFGGSITLCSMLFVCIIGYMYGPKYGLISAFAYGLLQFIQDPYIVTPVQVIIDYFLAFTALGLSGFIKTGKYRLQIGYLLGITGRFICAVISGVVFFGEYAPEGWNVLVYSMAYNGLVIYVEGIITIIILCIPAVKNGIDRIVSMSINDQN